MDTWQKASSESVSDHGCVYVSMAVVLLQAAWNSSIKMPFKDQAFL